MITYGNDHVVGNEATGPTKKIQFMDNVPETILCFERASVELLDVFLITQNVYSLELRISRDLIKFGVFVLYII